MSQATLNLTQYGEDAASLIPPDMQRRLRAQLTSRDHFYVMGSADDLLTWLGKGQLPRWIKDWLADGNQLTHLRCPASALHHTTESPA